MPGDVAVQEAPKELLTSGVGTQTGRFAHRRYTNPGTHQGNGQRRCTETGIQVPTPVPGHTPQHQQRIPINTRDHIQRDISRGEGK